MQRKVKGLIYLLCAAICFMFPKYYPVSAEGNTLDVETFVEMASVRINEMRIENGIFPLFPLHRFCKRCVDNVQKS